MSRLLLCRHGESVWNRDGRVQGTAAVPLTDRGREQARALGAHVAERHDVETLYSSGVRRAEETVELLCDVGVSPATHVTSPALREREQGVFQGLSRERAREEYPEYFVPRSDRDETFLGRRPPGGESYHDVENRVGAWWDDVRADRPSRGDTLVVTHGGVIRCLDALVSGDDLATVYRTNDAPANCCLWVVETAPESSTVLTRERPVDV